MGSKTITQALIDKLKPKATVYEVYDTKVKGFMVRVYPTGKKTYLVRYAAGKKITIAPTYQILPDEARSEANEICLNYRKGISPKQPKVEKSIAFKTFFDNKFKPAASTKDQDEETKRVERHFKMFFNMPINEIKFEHIEDWRNMKVILRNHKVNKTPLTDEQKRKFGAEEIDRASMANATINRTLTSLRNVFNLALQHEVINEHPMAKIKPLKTNQGRVRYLYEHEQKRIFPALIDRDNQLKEGRRSYNQHRKYRHKTPLPDKPFFGDELLPAILISLNTGLRKDELFSTLKSNIDLKNRCIFIPETKNNKSRSIPLNDIAHDTLKKWLKQNMYIKSPWLFPSSFNPKKHLIDKKKSWKNVLQHAKVNIENFTWHDMRHDFASNLAMQGVDLYAIANLLGHSDVRMAQKYAHLDPEYIKRTVGKLDQSKRFKDMKAS